MKTISQVHFQGVPFQGPSLNPRYIDRATRLYRSAVEIGEEVLATIAGIFGMPFRQLANNERLDRLDDHLLKDIGYARD